MKKQGQLSQVSTPSHFGETFGAGQVAPISRAMHVMGSTSLMAKPSLQLKTAVLPFLFLFVLLTVPCKGGSALGPVHRGMRGERNGKISVNSFIASSMARARPAFDRAPCSGTEPVFTGAFAIKKRMPTVLF